MKCLADVHTSLIAVIAEGNGRGMEFSRLKEKLLSLPWATQVSEYRPFTNSFSGTI